MKTSRSILMLLVAVAAAAGCEENAVQLIAGPQAGGANVKFFNFAPSSPVVNFFVNDKKATAVVSTGCSVLTPENEQACTTTGLESASGVAYGSPGNGVNAWYSDVAPGQITLQGKIAATTDKNLAITNLQATVSDGKYYSYYMSGIYNATTKTADSFIIEDQLPAGDFAAANVRFVNAISNANPMTLYLRNTVTGDELAIGAAIAYKAGGAFTAVPNGSYDLFTRYAGSSTNVITRTAVGFSVGRVYTITARGDITITSTTAANRPLLDNTANR